MTTLIERMRNLLETNPPGEWFVVVDDHMKDPHRLQIAINQAAGPMDNVASVTTRTINGKVRACWFGE